MVGTGPGAGDRHGEVIEVITEGWGEKKISIQEDSSFPAPGKSSGSREGKNCYLPCIPHGRCSGNMY